MKVEVAEKEIKIEYKRMSDIIIVRNGSQTLVFFSGNGYLNGVATISTRNVSRQVQPSQNKTILMNCEREFSFCEKIN